MDEKSIFFRHLMIHGRFICESQMELLNVLNILSDDGVYWASGDKAHCFVPFTAFPEYAVVLINHFWKASLVSNGNPELTCGNIKISEMPEYTSMGKTATFSEILNNHLRTKPFIY